jgi:DNA-binding SARP family transcriptional activator
MQGTAIELTAKQAAPASKSGEHLSVSLAGRLIIGFNGRRIELRTQKAGAVLGYLALSAAKHESRERLVGLLWSRSDEVKARASLRQVVRELRSIFDQAGYGGFVAGRLSIRLKPEQLEVDIDGIIQLAENGRVHSLLVDTPQLCERLFEGMDDLDPSFRVWLLAKRQTIHERLMRSLGAGLMNPDIAAGAKTAIATAIVNLDPTHEEACCHLMRAHAVNGDDRGPGREHKARRL